MPMHNLTAEQQESLNTLGKNYADTLTEWYGKLNCDDGDYDVMEEAVEMALSVEVRTPEWGIVNSKLQPTEYRILLAWGGPAVQIIGDLNEYLEPSTARLEVQDWGTPWVDHSFENDEDVLMTFAQCFYFGDR